MAEIINGNSQQTSDEFNKLLPEANIKNVDITEVPESPLKFFKCYIYLFPSKCT